MGAQALKLALVRQRYNPYGGAERFVERALAALAGEQITLICREWQGESAAQRILTCNPFHVGRMWRDWGFARCVRSAVAREHFDLVQSHERIPGCDIYRAGDGVHATWLELRARLQSPAARLATRLSPWHRYTLAAEARLFRHPDLRAVICNSRMVRDDIAMRFRVPADKLHVVYSGIDLEAFHPRLRAAHRVAVRRDLGIDQATPVFIYVGSGFQRKGVGALLGAFAQMPRRAQLLIIGRDRKQRRYEAQAARLNLEGRARFLGAQADVRPFYGAADAAVLPTLYDPFPNAALEALACGLPLLTSTSCGAAEVIEAGRNGVVCDPFDLARLAHALTLLAELSTGEHARHAARSTALQFDMAVMTKRLVDLYRSLLAAHEVG